MAQSEAHVMDVIQIHDETIFGNSRYNKVGLVEQVQNINQQITILQNASQSYDHEQLDEMLLLKADKTDTYTKTETDSNFVAAEEFSTLPDAKADKTDTYTKTETDSKLDEKANKTELIDAYIETETDSNETYARDEVYTKAEDDALLLLKADKTELINSYIKTETDSKLYLQANVADIVDSYSKTETDSNFVAAEEFSTLLDAKVDKTELDDYVDLTFAQTISGTKQFNIISIGTVSKQNINETSILLADGGDMLVSSLVTQPQLQEVRNIATGKLKAYVFSTQEELNDWMAIQDNVANLAIGDNLYIVDKQVTDYW
ncbi:MAG: hypothetical protein EZS28_019519 [Streblomastix strix]|uniref:Uncharacterized protein n=1 Tax=Streblomastix strix TaxID=222440 RepID=A0A5J4VR15_9EUKA|nr:MAG: hypothetical protein EZS28_019519 [Streblomastix strix]